MIKIQNENSYDIVKERKSNNTIVITCKKKERQCDVCSSVKVRQSIQMIKYPIIDKCLGRVVMTRFVCDDCYDDVMMILDNLKYK